MWSGSLVFWQGTRGRRRVVGIPSVSSDLSPGQGSSLVSFIHQAVRCLSVRCAIRHSRTSAFHRPRSIRALVAFFARQFRSRPFRLILSSFFSACYVAKSFFSSFCRRTLPGARLHRRYPGHNLRTSAHVCVKYAIHSSRTWSCGGYYFAGSQPYLELSWTHEAITVTPCRVSHRTHSSTVVALQYIMSEGLIWEVDLLITIYVKCKLSDRNLV